MAKEFVCTTPNCGCGKGPETAAPDGPLLLAKCGACGAVTPAIVAGGVVYTPCTFPASMMEPGVEYPVNCKAANEEEG